MSGTTPAGHPQGTLRQRLAGGPGSWQNADRVAGEGADRYAAPVGDVPPDPGRERVHGPDLGGVGRQVGWRRPVETGLDDRTVWAAYLADRYTTVLAETLAAASRAAQVGGPR